MKSCFYIYFCVLLQYASIAQTVGEIPKYYTFSDVNISLNTALNHTYSPITQQEVFYLGNDISLSAHYKPKNSHFQFGLGLGSINRVSSFEGDKENPIRWTYFSTGLYTDFLPYRKGHWYIRTGVNYNILLKAENQYTFFQDTSLYEPHYYDAMLGVGLKCFQYKRISLWVNAGYRYALSNVWTIHAYNPDERLIDTPIGFNEISLGISIKYHTSKYYAKK